MKKGGGKNKGSEFEREVGRILSRWISDGKKDDLFTRTVTSGGKFTTALKKGKSSGEAGDLMGANPMAYEFSSRILVECKHWNRLDFSDFLLGYGELYKALLHTQTQACIVKKQWMLIVRQNWCPIIVMMPLDIFLNRELHHHKLFERTIVMLRLKDFLGGTVPETIFEMVDEIKRKKRIRISFEPALTNLE